LRHSGSRPIEADRVDHRAREDVGADLGALLDDDHRQVGSPLRRELLEADGCGEARRTGSDDHHVEVHRFAFGQIHPFLLAVGCSAFSCPRGKRNRSHMNDPAGILKLEASRRTVERPSGGCKAPELRLRKTHRDQAFPLSARPGIPI
jgi:hypothetical protein